MARLSLVSRFVRFRRELLILWRAFLAPTTPMHLKALMLLVPAYLLSPVDIIPDIFPILGWLDDIVIVPMLVSWIVGMLPRGAGGDKTIDGTYRRR